MRRLERTTASRVGTSLAARFTPGPTTKRRMGPVTWWPEATVRSAPWFGSRFDFSTTWEDLADVWELAPAP